MLLRKPHHRVLTALVCSCLVQLMLYGTAQGQDPLTQKLETRRTVLMFQRMEDLSRFESSINYSGGEFTLKGLFSSSLQGDELVDTVSRKVDALYERVQEILDMRGQIPKVILRLYPNKDALARVYQAFTGSATLRVRAWYIYERNTIYLNVDDVHEGMLAHEIAHAIIDHYLTVRPPRATAEILARYVDEHL